MITRDAGLRYRELAGERNENDREGTMDGEPREFRNTGILIGIAIDPAGNRIELIQSPRYQGGNVMKRNSFK